jgi:homoserine kinase type II
MGQIDSEPTVGDPAWFVLSRLDAGEQAALAEAYDVGEWITWRRTPRGTANVTFFIQTTTGSYVVRRSNARKTVAGIRFEVRLLDYLASQGYPAPHVVRTRDGQAFTAHGGALYLMTQLIPGGEYDHRNIEHLRQAGAAFARYHRLVARFPGPYPVASSPLEGILDRGLGCFGRVLALSRQLLAPGQHEVLTDDLSWLSQQLRRCDGELAERYPDAGKLLIQASFGRSALIFAGDRVAGVVDYDRVRYDALGMDFAYTLKAFGRIWNPGGADHRVGLDPDLATIFLDAYRAETSLPSEEIAMLPLFFRAQRLVKVVGKCSNLVARHAVETQRAKDLEKVAHMARREVERLRWLVDHAEAYAAAIDRP